MRPRAIRWSDPETRRTEFPARRRTLPGLYCRTVSNDPNPPLHPALEYLEPLLGRWSGEGEGEYPTIETFRYGEEVRFWHTGKPFLVYSQRTWSLDDGRPLHAETGYWRAVGNRQVEVVLTHPTGVVEIEEGVIADGVIDLRSTVVGCTSTAKEVTQLSRRLVLGPEVPGGDGGSSGSLSYNVDMAAVGLPLQHHLAATLYRDASELRRPRKD